MPRVSPDMPRQMLPPPITTAISTPRSRRAAWISPAMRATTCASMWCPVSVFSSASPESFRTTRRNGLDAMPWTLLLADLHPSEAPDGSVAAQLLEQLPDRRLRIAHERLLEQHVLLVEAVEATLDDLRDRVVRLALVARE